MKQMLHSGNEIFCLKKVHQNCWHISLSHRRPVITYIVVKMPKQHLHLAKVSYQAFLISHP